ncbi:MAG: cadherin domain-containing protein, partial [Planctomycetaceae bacterium]|nr:cadherin domain-containing protein [Planctomycetaceae bacterium]
MQTLEPRVLLTAAPVGSEVRVNTYTTNTQQSPAIAVDADGDYVVVWQSNNQLSGSSSFDIRGRRYSAAGVAVGAEFQVNGYTTGLQANAAISMDAAGNFVVAWTSVNQAGAASGYDIYARRFNAAGVAQGAEFLVNTYTTNTQKFSKVAMDADGDFLVAWWSANQTSPFSGYDIYAQRFNAAGTAQGGEFLVNTVTAGNQVEVSVAVDAVGNSVIAWRSTYDLQGGPNSGSDIIAQRFNASGTAVGSEIIVNTYTVREQVAPTVAMDADGDFVIAWASKDELVSGSHYDIFAQRYNSSGAAQGAALQVNTYTTSAQAAPALAIDADGDFVVTWRSSGQDGDADGIYAQRFNAAGTPQAAEFRANTWTANQQFRSAVAMDADGDFIIAWDSNDQDLSLYGIYAQRYDDVGPDDADAAGPTVTDLVVAGNTVFAGEQLVVPPSSVTVRFSEKLTTIGTGGVSSVTNPANWGLTKSGLDVSSLISSVAFTLNATTAKYEAVVTFSSALTAGDYVLTAKQSITDIAGNQLDGDQNGVPGGDAARSLRIRAPQRQGSEFRANTYTTHVQKNPAIATDANGNFVVVWESYAQDGLGYGVFAQRYNAAGQTVGNEFQVNTYTTSAQRFSAVAMDADGDFVVTWSSNRQDGSSYGIYARRFDAAGVPQGSEFLVNTYTNLDQTFSAVAMDADGDFVVTWSSFLQDSNTSGIYAQRYNAQGAAQGSEFRVNLFTVGTQNLSSVDVDADGDFVVAWVSENQDGSSDGVYAQRFSAAGAAQGGEFRVNVLTTGRQSDPAVSLDADGNFVVVWDSYNQDGSLYGVYLRRYSAAGTSLDVTDVRVNSYTTGLQLVPAVAMDADGDFVVSWTSTGQDGNNDGVFAQRYSAAGATQGGEFRVNSHTTNAQQFGAIAVDADGDFVVAWESHSQDGNNYGVYAQRYAGGSVPTDVALSAATIVENLPSGTAVGNLSTTDADNPESFTYALVSGAGSADNASFQVVGSQLRTAASLDYEAGPTRSVRVRVTDAGGLTFEESFLISVIDVDEIPPTVSEVRASGDTVSAGERLNASPTALTVAFSENMSVAGGAGGANSVTNPANWLLTRNGLDVTNLVTGITFGLNGTTGMHEAVLAFSAALLPGDYVLTAQDALRDLVGNSLDGDVNGVPGGDFTRNFQVRVPQPIGGEVRVNAQTPNAQRDSTVAMDAAGNYLVAWQSFGQDGSDFGIYAQRYNAAGVALGSEFLVNTHTLFIQTYAAAAMEADGDFIVVWQSVSQDGSGYGIYAQRFNAAGTPQGGEFPVNSHTANHQQLAAVAMDADGDFVVVWESLGQDGSDYGIYAQRYSNAGVAQGSEFRVNSLTTNSQTFASVAMDADGDFVVAWGSDGQDGSDYGIYAQRYNAAGVAQGSEFRVNSLTISAQTFASVAMDADGDFLVAWQSYLQDGMSYGVYAQRYNAAGVAQGAEFRVNTYTFLSQSRPAVAMDADGDVVIAWESLNQDGSSYGIYAQRYNPAGVAQLGEFQVNSYTTSFQNRPAMAIDVDGDFVIAWQSFTQDGNGTGYGVYAQRYSGGSFPTDLALSANALSENLPVGTTVGTFSTTDVDGGDAFTYALVSGAGSSDNASFTIVGNQLKTAQVFDFETKSSYSLRIRTTDSFGFTFEKPFTVSVTDVQELFLLDDGDAGFTTTGPWNLYTSGGRGGDLRYLNPVSPAGTATWAFNGLQSGQYR